MEQSSKMPLMITKNSFSIKLTGKTAEALLKQPRPILWNNDGVRCWILTKAVKNQARVINDKKTHCKANDLPFKVEFTFAWNTHSSLMVNYEIEMAQVIEIQSKLLERITKAFEPVEYTVSENTVICVDEAICFAYNVRKILISQEKK